MSPTPPPYAPWWTTSGTGTAASTGSCTARAPWRTSCCGTSDPASFARVFAAKVDGARHLLEAAGDDTGFLVLFGSVAGVFGNRGQADYAAANDALDTLARAWSARTAGRVLAVDWGPWAADGGGMVTPELERAYARRGILLLDPAAAADALLAELVHGTSPQVVLAAQTGQEAAGNE
ncbi:ketoreductase domain-containing protein [Streptomyces lydicus]|nr:ketoreductase domain-containing protein [Streptomyces lydicus]